MKKQNTVDMMNMLIDEHRTDDVIDHLEPYAINAWIHRDDLVAAATEVYGENAADQWVRDLQLGDDRSFFIDTLIERIRASRRED